MSAAASPSTGRRYGLDRVCAAWGVPRSSHYAERARRRVEGGRTQAEGPHATGAEAGKFSSDRAPVGDVPSLPCPRDAATAAPQRSATEEEPAHSHAQPPEAASMARTGSDDVARSEHGGRLSAHEGADLLRQPRRRRGPKPRLSDARVLELVREDLALSPFRGEGHRKVFARLRRKKHPVFARQVLRVMREAKLLSPHRAPQGEVRAHEGTIVTERPNEMWGTDGLRVETVDDGWVWIFTVVEHWNAEVMGFHVTKRGDRFAALEPLKQGLAAIGRGVGRNAGAGLAVRMDHGTQYTSEHFRQEVKYWGMELSYGYVKEPQTNGVAERFNRTLKEQVLRGRVYRDVAELRAAVAAFVASYNDHWLIEKNGHRSPREMRALHQERMAA